MPRKLFVLVAGALTALLAMALLLAVRPALADANTATSKIDRRVVEDTANGEVAHFVLMLAEQADLSAAKSLGSKEEKGAYVVAQLRAVADRTQPAVIAQLEQLGVSYRPYWVANMIAVTGDRSVVEALAQNPAVRVIEPNRVVHLDEPVDSAPAGAPEAVEWGVMKINADDVWAMGFRGEGMVVADQDTGMDWDHPALINQYRGWDGSAADHNYSWWDAIHQDIDGDGTNPCGFNLQAPCDDNGHGTHTAGTTVGDDGGANQIGVAPGAEWIGCRNMEEGNGRPTTYSECFQFFLAPTDLAGNNPDPSLAPDVVSNSWSCPIGPPPGGEDCQVGSIQSAVEAVRAAGILVAESAGNSGPGCSTVNTPIAIYDASTSVGATDINDNIAGFSSRGPVTVDGSNRLKPDISAPGVNVRSSIPGGGYTNFSGTSMAAPHLAGAVALLQQARPELRGNVDATEAALFFSAIPRTTTQDCGSVDGDSIPNNTYGWGRLDVLASVESGAFIELSKTVSADLGTCGDSDTITVPAGTEVTYCYTVHNASSNAIFTLHTLEDSHLGSLLVDEPVSLEPDQTYVFFSDSTNAVINETTTNTASWTAEVATGERAVASDSATVIVEPVTAVSLSGLESGNIARAPWLAALPLGLALAAGLLWRRRRQR